MCEVVGRMVLEHRVWSETGGDVMEMSWRCHGDATVRVEMLGSEFVACL